MLTTRPAAPEKRLARNETMDLLKLIASIIVVFDHAMFPGRLGSWLVCLCSFAVPMFFAISGYFNYQASAAQIRKRVRAIFKLLVIGTLFQILGNCIVIELNHGSTIAYLRAAIPDPDEIVNCVLLHVHPYSGQLWFLNGLIAVYLVFLLFTRFQNRAAPDYRPFYFLCGIQLAILFAFGTLAPEAGLAVGIPVRNGWFLGIPMFGAGLFLREYQQRILSMAPRRWWVLVCAALGGMGFSILEMEAVGIGILPFGMYIAVTALMLLAVSYPALSRGSGAFHGFLAHCGSISTWIYLFHVFFITKYEEFLKPWAASFAGEAEPYLFPVLILVVSVVNAVLWEIGSSLLKARKKRG